MAEPLITAPGAPEQPREPVRTPYGDYCRYRDAMQAMRDAQYEAWCRRILESAR